MPDKQQIVSSIEKIARKLGRAPTRPEFNSHSESRRTMCCNTSERGARRSEPGTPAIHAEYEEGPSAAGRLGRGGAKKPGVPPRHVHPPEGNYNPGTLEKRFGPWTRFPKRFAISPGASPSGQTSWLYSPVVPPRHPGESRSHPQNAAAPTAPQKVAPPRGPANLRQSESIPGVAARTHQRTRRRPLVWDVGEKARLPGRKRANGIPRLRSHAPDRSRPLAARLHRI